MKRVGIEWPASRAQTLYLRFKQNIIDRTWTPDEPLNIDQLAVTHGVSITPVREALARLTADRLVVAETNKGYRVAPPPTPERFADIAAVRLLLEPFAARTAAARISATDEATLLKVHRMISKLSTSAKFENIQAFTSLNRDFHEQLVRLTGNQVFIDTYEQLGYHVVIGHHHHLFGLSELPAVIGEHDAIVRALVARDPDAAEEAMRAHIEIGSRRIAADYERRSNAARGSTHNPR